MKQNKVVMRLLDFTKDDHPFGNKQGRETFALMSDYIDEHPALIYEVSIKGIKATDVSFPRESVISLVKLMKGERGVFLSGEFSRDLLDNWHYAAVAKEQPVIVSQPDGYTVIGPSLNEGARDLFDFIMSEGEVTTAKVAQRYDVSSQNASAKLKKLYQTGLILARKSVADSGGHEFVYSAIK